MSRSKAENSQEDLDENQTSKMPEHIKSLISHAIPVRKAVFHRTVIFHNKMAAPEHCYMSSRFAKDVKKYKIANMWLTPYVLICEQEGEYKLIPLANVSDITY